MIPDRFRLPALSRGRILRCSILSLLLLLFGWSTIAVAQEDTSNTPSPVIPPDSLPGRSTDAALKARADSLDTLLHHLLTAPGLPQFRKLRAAGGISRGVVAGGLVSLELSTPILSRDPTVTLSGLPGSRPEVEGIQGLKVPISDLTDTILTIRVPDTIPRGEYQVRILMAGQDSTKPDVLQRPRVLYVASLINIIGLSLLPILVLTAMLWLVTRRFGTTSGIRGLRILFLEPENMTYSLSRAQFLLWAAAIAWGYMFLFFARGLVEDTWTFPPLSGFIYTFLISLGTLIGAQATTSVKGMKGAGDVHPSLADLVVHGGVIALERVQQILWTLIAIAIFLVTIVKNYANATTMPEIPEELLVLMGISSAGYLAGKAARKPGPIIQKVEATQGNSINLTIRGEHISREAILWVDGVQRPEKPMVVTADPDDPNEFAKELMVTLNDVTLPQWQGRAHKLLIVNADGQRCEWHTTPRILNVTADAADTEGKVPLTITTEYVPQEATVNVLGAQKEGSERRDPQVPNILMLTVTPANPQERPFDKIEIPYGGPTPAEYSWQSGSSTSAWVPTSATDPSDTQTNGPVEATA